MSYCLGLSHRYILYGQDEIEHLPDRAIGSSIAPRIIALFEDGWWNCVED